MLTLIFSYGLNDGSDCINIHSSFMCLLSHICRRASPKPSELPPSRLTCHLMCFQPQTGILSAAPDWRLKGSFPSVWQDTLQPFSIRYRLRRPLIIISAHKDFCSSLVFQVATDRLVWMKSGKCGDVGDAQGFWWISPHVLRHEVFMWSGRSRNIHQCLLEKQQSSVRGLSQWASVELLCNF